MATPDCITKANENIRKMEELQREPLKYKALQVLFEKQSPWYPVYLI
jgi:hypothetical protein